MRTMAWRCSGLLALALLSGGIGNAAHADVTVENNVEYSNPDNQHLMVNMARPSGPDSAFSFGVPLP